MCARGLSHVTGRLPQRRVAACAEPLLAQNSGSRSYQFPKSLEPEAGTVSLMLSSICQTVTEHRTKGRDRASISQWEDCQRILRPSIKNHHRQQSHRLSLTIKLTYFPGNLKLSCYSINCSDMGGWDNMQITLVLKSFQDQSWKSLDTLHLIKASCSLVY